LNALNPSGKPVVFVSKNKQSAAEAGPQFRILHQQEGWLEALVLVSAEILRLGQALARAHHAEQAKKSLEQQAALGRYMLEVRHTLNNSLTSVLGNSELLVLDPGSLSASERSQIETIRNMAVRMHEILRRFSSIEKELNAVEKQAENEARTKSRAATASF
jgi:signal transduction histidine kinase